MAEGYSPLEGGGVQRTEMHCHACDKNFVAELDFDVGGDRVIECPSCGHEHWRTIKDGKITAARWGRAPEGAIRVSGRSVWKSTVIKAQTSTVAAFIRERWLNRSDFNGH
jgi:DNA-directed RNA polymerase subunit RPC12/RpoP